MQHVYEEKYSHSISYRYSYTQGRIQDLLKGGSESGVSLEGRS